MAKHIDYNHPLRWRGGSSSRSWAMYAKDIPQFKQTHKRRVEGLIDPGWVIVERINYNRKKYYEYWITHDNKTFWFYSSYWLAILSQNKYPQPQLVAVDTVEPQPQVVVPPTAEPQPQVVDVDVTVEPQPQVLL